MKRPLLGIAIAFSAGILSEQVLDIPVFYLLAYAVVFLFLAVLFKRSRTAFLIFAALVFLFTGALASKQYNSLPRNHIKNLLTVPSGLHKQVFLRGQIINEPAQKITYYKMKESRFLLEANALKAARGWQPVSGIVSVNVFDPRCDFKYGDRIILEGEIYQPRGATNPGQFDYKKFLERKKIFYVIRARKGDFYKIVSRGRILPVRAAAYKVRERAERFIDAYFPFNEAAVLKAILLGKREDIDDDINEDFVKTGTAHILAISGLHVGLLVYIFILLFKFFRLPFKVWFFILAPLVLFYAVMVDSRPPVTRAAVMTLVFLLGRLLKREQDLLNTLGLSALVILYLNPNDIMDIGFQLSFLTVGSIIYFTPRLHHYKAMPLKALAVSFCAWMGSAPFIAAYFNIFSPVTIIANLFVVPWMFFVLSSAVIFVLFGAVSPILALIFSQTADFSILVLLKAAAFLANFPSAYFYVKSPPWILILVFYLFLFLFFERKRVGIRAKFFLFGALIFINLVIWINVIFTSEAPLKISFLDVGKGDSILLEFPRGGTMLIDGGEALGADMGRTVVGRYLSSKGINKIDVVLATHPHTDHVGGLVWVLKNFRVGLFLDNGDMEANPLYAECQRLIKQKKVKKGVVREGDTITGFYGAKLLVLNPPLRKFEELNDNSIVIKVCAGDFSALLCGDIREEAAKNLLLVHAGELPSKILKVPHHGGSLGDAGQEFFETINPEITVISLGNKGVNREAQSALNGLKTEIYRTDRSGAVIITDGRK
ncbi:MAG: DNA internalization-related competence protein ComEC/Rec2 [Candidatus Omnitrophica bacterium]|nr:DNA internalization-related competence protein ComEC/Rec2 [Candidatus Omnitrophota bacterium]